MSDYFPKVFIVMRLFVDADGRLDGWNIHGVYTDSVTAVESIMELLDAYGDSAAAVAWDSKAGEYARCTIQFANGTSETLSVHPRYPARLTPAQLAQEIAQEAL